MISRRRQIIHAIENELFKAEVIEEKQAAEDIKFGPELLDEVIKEPTLDIYLDRSPKVGIPINYEEMVRIEQRKRAAYINAEQKKKEPKDEGEDT